MLSSIKNKHTEGEMQTEFGHKVNVFKLLREDLKERRGKEIAAEHKDGDEADKLLFIHAKRPCWKEDYNGELP